MNDSREPASVELSDDGLARRAKALACTAPLQALDENKGSLRWVEASVYQLAEIALHTIDQVTISMDFDSGANQQKVVDQVARFAALQAPERTAEEHSKVARHVLQRLINVGTVDRSFAEKIGSIDRSGVYRRYDFRFNLLVERAGPDGKIYLRASDEAINVLVGALDTDVESAQIAAEVKLESLIRRRKIAEAKLAAEQARYRTVQYGEMLRQLLDATSRDIRAVDWEQEVPKLLADALIHIEERYDFEHRILSNISELRDKSDEPLRKRKAAELVTIVRDCIRRHMQLQQRLLTAGALFREEQDRQQFAELPVRSVLDLHGQLLTPALGLPLGDALTVGKEFFRGATGARPPVVLELSGLVTRLLRPMPERDRLGEEIPEPDLTDTTEKPVFSLEDWAATDALLDLRDTPRQLSDLLTEAERNAPSTAALLLHRAVNAFNPHVGESIARGDSRLLVGVATGDRFDHPHFGGDGLLLYSAPIVSPPDASDAPDPSPFFPRNLCDE
ncbi:hypothetical protein ACIQRW_01365 [Streptomyces sp. NPDC091287]|uniref:hypothetical protein n=1 Tax=Streptomyces sp. NPDC091287 TaxID=3365988 RepID=UPI00381E3344